MPEIRGAQIEAVKCLEESLVQDKPRALIQMATGSGKTFTAINAIYRLIKFGKAKRVLFLVDRANLARQALKEFQAFETSDDGRKFTELYNVQRLTSNSIMDSSRVVISTIQRVYSMLKDEPERLRWPEKSVLHSQIKLTWCHIRLGGSLKVEPERRLEFLERAPNLETFNWPDFGS